MIMIDENAIYNIIDFDADMRNNEFVGMRFSEDMQRAMTDYLFRGWQPGGHLTAMLAHDYQRAMWNADIHSRTVIWATARWIFLHVPPSAQGSYDAVKFWQDNPALRDQLYNDLSKKKMWSELTEDSY